MKKPFIAGMTALLLTAPFAIAEGKDAHPLMLITNTYEDSTTGGEQDWTLSSFAHVSDEVELPSYIDLYDIDVSIERISFTWVETEFSKQVGGVLPEGQYDRNYFTLELPEGMQIAAIEYDTASGLAEGSALPTARVVSPNRVMIEFGPGVNRVIGFNPAFTLTLGPITE